MSIETKRGEFIPRRILASIKNFYEELNNKLKEKTEGVSVEFTDVGRNHKYQGYVDDWCVVYTANCLVTFFNGALLSEDEQESMDSLVESTLSEIKNEYIKTEMLSSYSTRKDWVVNHEIFFEFEIQ